MGVIIPVNQEVRRWQGVHLFHFGLSNCSQRVRMMLEEKGIAWTSHYLNIPRNENLSDWYQDINPKAVVPTLVHDGVVIVESNDILYYLNGVFSGPDLLHQRGIDVSAVERLLAAADDFQSAVKVLTHEFLFKPATRKSAKNLRYMERHLRNKELLAFHQRFSEEGFSAEELQQAIAKAHCCMAELDRQLADNEWLAGAEFSLVDISWIVNVHRLELMRFPLGDFANVQRWFAAMRARPSYKRALVAFEPLAVRLFVRSFGYLRSLLRPNLYALRS